MSLITLVFLLMLPVVVNAGCREGYVPTDVEGVCMAQPVIKTNPEWVSEEKPPSDKMPSWQREGIVLINAPNMAAEDAKMDADKREANSEGKRKAGIK